MALKRTRVFIVDDNRIVRETLADLINHEPDFFACGQAKTGQQALADIPHLRPDIVIVDVSLRDMNGMDLAKKLAGENGAPAILVIAMQEAGVYSAEAFAAGAKGYLMKGHAAEKVVEAVRALARGEVYGEKPQGALSNEHS